ncbi:MAG: NUDIX domain-containing protein [Candidatus Buchananbacteria bacterium]
MLKSKNIIIASGPVIIEKDKVLLTRHGTDGYWKFPGGRVENYPAKLPVDFLEREAAREVKEEMGVEIKIIRPLKPMLVKKNDNTMVVLIHYLARRIGKIKPGVDIIEWSWFDLKKLPQNCAPNIRPVLREI